jgi:hypothetical protein
MANTSKPLIVSLAATVGMLICSSVASAQISFSDDFNDRTLLDPTIGNNWTWFDTGYAADCSTFVGGYGPYSDGDGSDYVHGNQNFTRLGGDGGGYFRAGLQGADGAASLEVYHNQYAGNPCNEIKIFQEFSGGAPGDYTFTATVIGNEFTPIGAGNSVGVFMKVLNVDAGYSEAQFVKVPITPPAFDAAPLDVSFNFTVNSDVSNRIVQIGMYAQHGPGGTASAIWDNVAVAEASAGGGSGNGGSSAAPNRIPALPLWALLGLASLIGLLGLRQKR